MASDEEAGVLPGHNHSRPTVLPNQFSNAKSLGAAIKEWLLMIPGNESTKDEIAQALKDGSADMGKYPKRAFSLALTNNPKLFEIDGNVVRLKRPT